MLPVSNNRYRESFIQEYFPKMMAKAVQIGAAATGKGEAAREGGDVGQQSGGAGRSLAPPPAYEAVPRGQGTGAHGYRSLLD